ncbi:Vacuolar protein sorting-associated protein [Wickerhamomyces ciferrii]|uniref:Vacuolar protein sorting-associated protein n=1 Tax=Wickerhamomyces ciferrii (strain ATCC 14091 / BCRC 22168 / CBS 111 / JCM 3599 / NBRC 0793 / NRRL Y-1031 F-60-10) TaxID=1206466 RepID=K0KMT7_WICCF|nr:Vacuolar protein sorting-associated protein [Wickerhamomyces ciferrii]CCH42438.1 Vacuolar protein sorting-associated protein [Wickerhamomyces ciferrii]
MPSAQPETPPSIRENQVQNLSDTASFQSDSTFKTTPLKPSRNISFQSPNFSSRTSINSSISTKRRFDERIRSRFSDIIKHTTPQLDIQDSDQDEDQDDDDNDNDHNGISSIKWANLKKLNDILQSSQSKQKYGDPTCIAPGDIVAIGTSKGYTLIFDYNQNLLHSLGKDTKALTCGEITSISISMDSTHVATGFESGDIFLWNINSSDKPITHIQHLNETNLNSDGHVLNSSINNITFVGKRRSVLISTDIDGLVFYHQCNKRIIGTTVSTRKILGNYPGLMIQNRVTIFGCAALPLGPSVDFLDTQGIIAILSDNALLILSTSNSIKTQFKTGKPKVLNESLGKTGCLSWFPSFKGKNGIKSPAKLVYCWSNVLTVIEAREYNEVISCEIKKRWVCDEAILGVQWLSESMIGIITKSQQIILLNEKSLKLSSKIDLISKHIYKNKSLTKISSPQSNYLGSYQSSFKTFKGKIFLVGKYELFVGSIPNWLDLLYDQVNKGRYIKSIDKARRFYIGNEDLEAVGLPASDKDRQQLVLKYLIDLVKASATKILTSGMNEDQYEDQINDFLYSCMKAFASINADIENYEELYEIFKFNYQSDLFFNSLEPFILSGLVKTLSPLVLKDMVSYYSTKEDKEKLEQLICLLDIKSLDIDYTINLLKSNGLRDSYIYIWNKLLGDYVTPFVEFVRDIQNGHRDSVKVFGYLTYILTGRQYPTENFIGGDDELDAKLTLYYVLFNGSFITWPQKNGENILVDSNDQLNFPYLYLLLNYDSSLFFAMLNECFEDTLLNEDELSSSEWKLKVNRQFIIDIIIELFSETEFSKEAKINFSIFLSRNYPKFKQFIRLSEDVLEELINDLSQYNDEEFKSDCELSLQSLLSVYQPANRDELLQRFQQAGFNDVLMNLYVSDQRYSDVLELWISSDKSDSIETNDEILEKCFKFTENKPNDRLKIQQVVFNNFAKLVEYNTSKVARILNHYSPKSHQTVLKLEDLHLKHLYLSSLSDLESSGLYKMKLEERDQYIDTLAKFDKRELDKYIKSLSPSDYNFDLALESLRSSGAIETLIDLFTKQDRYEDALNEVLNQMEILVHRLPDANNKSNKDDLKHLEEQIWGLLFWGISLSNHEGSTTQTKNSDSLSLNENLWLNLIKFTVNLFKFFDKDETSTKVLDIMKRLVQDLFSNLINTRAKINSFKVNEEGINEHQSSFLKIYAKFLESSSTKVTLLGDVRSVTNEIYLAFSYEKNALEITAQLINEGIFKNMEKLNDKNLKGWSVLHYECDACGKTIWGRGIESDAYCKWEDKQREDPQNPQKEEVDPYYLVSFSCRHQFHMNCLKNLGVGKELTCVICDTDNQKN